MKQSIVGMRSNFRHVFVLVGLIAAVGAVIKWTAPPRAHAQTQVSANPVSANDVLPVLQRCFQCHGPSLKMSKLDLSSRDGMLKGGEKGPALVPGNAEASPLYRRVAGFEQPAMPMPPVPALNAAEVALVKNWIDQGAKWDSAGASPAAAAASSSTPAVRTPYGVYTERQITDADRQWWAFQRPVRHNPPTVSDSRWSPTRSTRSSGRQWTRKASSPLPKQTGIP